MDVLSLVTSVAAAALEPARQLVVDRLRKAREKFLRERRLQKYWTVVHYLLGTLAVVLGAGAGASVLASLAKWIPATMAFAAAIVAGIVTFTKPEARMEDHRHAAAEWEDEELSLQTALAIDLVDEDLDREELLRRLKPILDRHHERLASTENRGRTSLARRSASVRSDRSASSGSLPAKPEIDPDALDS